MKKLKLEELKLILANIKPYEDAVIFSDAVSLISEFMINNGEIKC